MVEKLINRGPFEIKPLDLTWNVIETHRLCACDRIYMSIDPGVVNTGVVILRICTGGLHKPEVLWHDTFSMNDKTVGHTILPNPEAAWYMRGVLVTQIKEFRPNVVLIEYQPPINRGNVALIRWNCWIEGYLFAALEDLGTSITHVNPASIKKFFDIHEDSYHRTKSRVVVQARDLIPELPTGLTDHIADCVLMSFYYHANKT